MIKLALTIIFFISALVLGIYGASPGFADYNRQLEEKEALEKELDNTITYIEELKITEERIKENKEELELLETAFPSYHDAPTLFLYLQQYIEKNNLNIEGGFGSFSVAPYRKEDTDHGRIKEVSFDVSLSGNYENMKGFLHDMEKMTRIVNLKNVDISLSPFEEEFVIRISATTFSY